MYRLLLKLSFAILFAFTATNVSAASIVINANGKLAGLKGISVEGFGIYDVTFNNVFDYSRGGNSQSFATAAANALYAAFNGDGIVADTAYDKTPELVEGCENYLFCELATILVHSPGFDTGSYMFFRNMISNFEVDQETISYAQGNLYPTDTRAFAYWTESSLIATPVPAALFLFAPALLGAIGLRRKAKIFPATT